MESLPTEILDHIFNHFPNKCEICQNKCLRALGWQELSKCSKTCKRWNRIIEEIDMLEKCFSDFENVISVTLNIPHEAKWRSWALGIMVNRRIISNKTMAFEIIFIEEDCPVSRDGRMKIGDFILQVNGISFDKSKPHMFLDDYIGCDLVNILKDQYVQMVVGQIVKDKYQIKEFVTPGPNRDLALQYEAEQPMINSDE